MQSNHNISLIVSQSSMPSENEVLRLNEEDFRLSERFTWVYYILIDDGLRVVLPQRSVQTYQHAYSKGVMRL